MNSEFFSKRNENNDQEGESQIIMDIIRKRFIFTGRVQGVGFRYRAAYIARKINITGWVKNNWDGSVQMEAQGTEEEINKMLTLINQGSYISIDFIESQIIEIENSESGFHIR